MNFREMSPVRWHSSKSVDAGDELGDGDGGGGALDAADGIAADGCSLPPDVSTAASAPASTSTRNTATAATTYGHTGRFGGGGVQAGCHCGGGYGWYDGGVMTAQRRRVNTLAASTDRPALGCVNGANRPSVRA